MNLFIQYSAKLSRAAAVASVAVIVVAFASMTGPAYADHDPDHVDDLKGRIGDIERKIWDCENNTGACVAIPVTDTLDDLSMVCTQGQTVKFDETNGWVCS